MVPIAIVHPAWEIWGLWILLIIFAPLAVIAVIYLFYGYFTGRIPNAKLTLGSNAGGANICPACGTQNAAVTSDVCATCNGPLENSGVGYGTPATDGHGASQAQAQPVPGLGKPMGVIKHDITIENKLAFKSGEMVRINQVSPDLARPEYKYVIQSASLGKAFRLSDNDLDI